ncbi:hypothetical protein BD309DRAFT_964560 [Dichomitus squalens]|nr:hypothetical protein BD309DRAFT_964560 [Dichomitus squalens]
MLPHTLWSFLFLSVFSSFVSAQGPVQTLFPASIPLAVKHPYMSVWYASSNTSLPLSNSWPVFWGQASIIGWAGKIRVDGTTYKWLGNDPNGGAPANVTNVQFTPTRTIFVMQAGPMNLTVTFLTPIEPDDWVKQSIPFSYISVEAQSLDGNSHAVQLYSDISAEWLSGNRSSPVQWSNNNTGNTLFHEIELQQPQQDVEINHQAQDGKAYYAMPVKTGVSWQIDTDQNTRSTFVSNGNLHNTASTAFAPISPVFTVFAIAIDLGTITSTSDPVTWSVGYVRDPVISYTTATGATQQRRPLWATQYSSVADVIDAFTADFPAAHDRAVALDAQILGSASQISSEYADLVALATRQAVSALDFTVGTDSKGNVDPGDVKLFMKNIGTDQRVSPVEHIFAAFPTYLYLNASWGGALLEPLLELQDSQVGQQFAAQDLGDSYPVASGARGAAAQGIEQSGNMLITLLAQARLSGNGTLLIQHYNTTKRWADYLNNNALTPNGQRNADGETSANMTNLAIKGIIGVKAMAEIARVVGEEVDAAQYDGQAAALLGEWQSLATGTSSHLLGRYGDQGTWSLMYNMFADKMLGLNFIPQTVISEQTQFYSSLLTTASQLGLPIDSDSGQTSNAAWLLFTSAFVSDSTVRDNLIKGVHNHANFNQSSGVFPEIYNDATGAGLNGFAGPALGALFSHLALTVPNTTISTATSTTGTGDSNGNGGDHKGGSSNGGAIAGGVIGGLAIVGIAIGIFFLIRRRRRNQGFDEREKIEIVEQAPHVPTLAPYSYYEHPAPGSPRAGAGYVPVSPHSETTAGFAGLGSGGDGQHGAGHHLSEGNLAYATDSFESMQPSAVHVSKAREAAQTRVHAYAPSIATSSAVGSALGSQTGSASSRDPLSPGSGSATGSGSVATSLSPTDVLGLRAEVENLRRVMQEIRAERFEPPPEYVEE